ncbi:hypothetical protein SprV_0200563600 [Sparganum proliferum]
MRPLPAGRLEGCRSRPANPRRVDKLTYEGQTEEMPIDNGCDRYLLVMGIDSVCDADNGRTASISSSAAEESQATVIGESNQRRRKRKTLSECCRYRRTMLANEGADRRREMIVAIAC